MKNKITFMTLNCLAKRNGKQRTLDHKNYNKAFKNTITHGLNVKIMCKFAIAISLD